MPRSLQSVLVLMSIACLLTAMYAFHFDHHKLCVRMSPPQSKYRGPTCLETKDVPGPNIAMAVLLATVSVGLLWVAFKKPGTAGTSIK